MVQRPEISSSEEAGAQAIGAGLRELMAHAGHDLIGPLNRAASLLALLIHRHRNQLGPEGDRVLALLEASSAHMEDVAAAIDRYLEIASAPPEFAEVDLNESVAKALAVLERSIIGSGATVEVDTLPRVSANAGQMITVFELLIGNSLKFSRPRATPRVRIS